jgi:hypothetical protein
MLSETVVQSAEQLSGLFELMEERFVVATHDED